LANPKVVLKNRKGKGSKELYKSCRGEKVGAHNLSRRKKRTNLTGGGEEKEQNAIFGNGY